MLTAGRGDKTHTNVSFGARVTRFREGVRPVHLFTRRERSSHQLIRIAIFSLGFYFNEVPVFAIQRSLSSLH